MPKPDPITLSTRIRLARNLREFPFPGKAQATQKMATQSSLDKLNLNHYNCVVKRKEEQEQQLKTGTHE